MNLDLFVSFCYNCQSQDYCLVLFGQKKFTTVHVCFELSLFWPAIGWNLAASADQPIAGQNRLSSKRVDFYSAKVLGCEIVFHSDHLRSTDLSAPSGVIKN